MEQMGAESETDIDPDLVELEALEREIAALEGELTVVDGTAPEAAGPEER
jgi:hypothetical protein